MCRDHQGCSDAEARALERDARLGLLSRLSASFATLGAVTTASAVPVFTLAYRASPGGQRETVVALTLRTQF
jgi:hypothetical protein